MSAFRTAVSKVAFFALTIAPLAYMGCNYRVEKGGSGPTFRKLNDSEIPDFATIAEIFSRKCQACHAAKDQYTTTDFQQTAVRLEPLKRRLLTSGRDKMPPEDQPQLTQDELSLVIGWIDAGGKLNKDTLATPTPARTKQPSFAELSKAFLGGKCFGCHKPGDELTPALNTYALFKDRAATIRDYIQKPTSDPNRMPPEDEAQLTPEELKTLIEWIDAGAPENGI